MNGNIVVGVDESAQARAALQWAVDQAGSDQPLTALMAWGYGEQHHLERDAAFDPHYGEEVAGKVVEELVVHALGNGHRVRCVAVRGAPAAVLLDAAKDAALVVVGARGMGGFRGLMLGSVSHHVLHGARCPAAVVRDAAVRAGEPIVVGVDGSPPSRRALAWAIDHARRRGSRLVAMHAWYLPSPSYGMFGRFPDPIEFAADADQFLEHQVNQIDTSGLVAPVECRAVGERPAAALLEASALAAMVVIGSRGRGHLTSFALGSVSDQLSHHATCPVIVVK